MKRTLNQLSRRTRSQRRIAFMELHGRYSPEFNCNGATPIPVATSKNTLRVSEK